MFKKIQILLTGPICSCDKQDLSWGLGHDGGGRSTLTITCKLCETGILVPNKKFVAGFTLDERYPDDKSGSEKSEPEPRSVPKKPGQNNANAGDFFGLKGDQSKTNDSSDDV